ncbi:SDR family oxidoreductase [Herbaspirillum seropedicae]|uniref:3-oxoacyl-(Acyl-carrier protein) reductase protein n=2 Tax=Herbaspirillum seropedicae TaxID=964 RepID=D8IYE3_HERSS|nr:SDR family NAD(P)-dependent oxidoreductase [Herbaspirillum seropedicae]ADJ62103.1 3-oxoacyl-(acyl-carrier protein) reductase protein [Herbaspirillum seropedicae SmR1]AKN64272.1 3-oxoacyl-ACP reductase [Herbaspirillum seropedicae]NQE27860.1 3-oxoacyl-ACP reductase [Herbaspirillum seropedicae]UMU20187.1 SDR family oxidoreductase [Herbaspirillum seropedicae]
MTYSRASYDFGDCVAVVTGGHGGIGAAISARLAAGGAQVVVWDQHHDAASPYRQQSIDITDAPAVMQAAQELLADTGRIDFLINNAGYAGPTVPLDEYDVGEWHRIVQVNLLGVFHACRSVTPAMRAARRGRIVNIASLAGKEGTPNASAYSAAKAGVLALTKSLGKELAESGVLVNAIAPAAVKTALLGQMSPAHVQTMIAKSPMHRLGSVDEVADMCAWLCSGSCSFNTGAVFDLSGGRATY